MSISDKNKIDLIGTDEITNEVILTVSDHLDWEDKLFHLEALQEKMDTYIAFIESGQIEQDYPNSKGKTLVIEIVSKYEYPNEGISFLENVRSAIKRIGVEIRQKVIS